MTCATCRYACPSTPATGPEVIRCRRFPPTPTGNVHVWPVVNSDDWCGEWEEVGELTRDGHLKKPGAGDDAS